jgi:hypothetical protein
LLNLKARSSEEHQQQWLNPKPAKTQSKHAHNKPNAAEIRDNAEIVPREEREAPGFQSASKHFGLKFSVWFSGVLKVLESLRI